MKKNFSKLILSAFCLSLFVILAAGSDGGDSPSSGSSSDYEQNFPTESTESSEPNTPVVQENIKDEDYNDDIQEDERPSAETYDDEHLDNSEE